MPPALPSEPYAGRIWRLVEAQHAVATLPLVDSLEEQAALEAILERSKPAVPGDCAHLHYLLATPFRYGCYPSDSRFRRKGRTPGVFYGAEAALTAAMENVWYRLRFYAAAEGVAPPAGAAEYTGFAVDIAADSVDLMRPPLNADAALWTDPEDYTACLDLADRARAQGLGLIRYQSVRDPDRGANIAVLQCAAFATPEPVKTETWRIALRPNGAVILQEWPRSAWEVRRDGTTLAFL